MGTVRLVKAAMPHLEAQRHGSIIAISSVSGREVDFAAGPYGTAKAALVHYMSGLAFQLAGTGIRANTVSPGQHVLRRRGVGQHQAGQPGPLRRGDGAEPDRSDGHAVRHRQRRGVPRQPGVEPHLRRTPGRRRRPDPRRPALSAVLTRALGRATLARQLLLEPAGRPVVDTLEHLVGLQGQVPRVPHLALWDWLSDYDPAELDGLMTSRVVVRTQLMRTTIHMATAADALALRPCCSPSSTGRSRRRRGGSACAA